MLSLLDQFASLDVAVRESLADIASPLELALATLLVAKEKCATDGLTAESMVAALEAAGVAAKRAGLVKALARAGNRVSRRPSPDGTIFRLMLPGAKQVTALLGQGNLQVVRFDGTAPRTARQRVSELLSGLKGLVRICDPYYGLRTLDVLESIPKTVRVRFLTARTSESGSKLTSALKDFRKERPLIEFRTASTPGDLHDRYVASADALMLVGHGLKDVGAKESFVVSINSTIAKDLLNTVAAAFDTKWSAASPL